MNYRDTLVTCEECGKQFIDTVEKQRQRADQGLEVTIPTLCQGCAQRTSYGGRLHGRIKWFDPGKGYGFIVEDTGSQLFVHRSGMPQSDDGTPLPLEEGQEVLYDVLETPKGPQAVQVSVYKG